MTTTPVATNTHKIVAIGVPPGFAAKTAVATLQQQLQSYTDPHGHRKVRVAPTLSSRIVRCVEQFGNEVGSHSVRLDQHNPSRPPERAWLDDVTTTCAFPEAWVLPPGSTEATKRNCDNRYGC
jgi:hypothetical protein